MSHAADPVADLVDLRFALQGSIVGLDYADALATALEDALPWFGGETQVGVHPLGGLSPGAGVWYLSSRTRLTLRLPRQRLDAARRLTGTPLTVGEHVLSVGASSTHDLMHASVVYASFVTFGVEAPGGVIDEAGFLARCRRELEEMNLATRLICGKAKQASSAAGLLSGFSLMVADLDVAGTLLLQQQGLGNQRKRGCGIFVPHKSMAPAATLE